MLWRISFLLNLALVPANAQTSSTDKPSPVPAHNRRVDRARPLEITVAPVRPFSTTPVSPIRSDSGSHVAPPNPVEWGTAQAGTSVFFSSSVFGKRSASGALLDPEEMIAAHASLPFGTLVRVTNTKNGKEATVRIVDRISASSRHIISVSEKAASELDFKRAGIGQVKILPVNKQ